MNGSPGASPSAHPTSPESHASAPAAQLPAAALSGTPRDETTYARDAQGPDAHAPLPGVVAASDAWGALLRPLFDWAFSPVTVPAEAAQELRDLARRGTVVHVGRSAALVTFLFFQHLFVRLSVPVARAVTGLGVAVWKPWGRLVAGRRQVRAPQREDVEAAVRAGESALVFLRRPGTLGAMLSARIPDPFPALVRLQRESARPIFLVPELLVWERTPPNLRKRLFDVLFGEPEAPGFWRSVVSLVWNRRRAFVKVGAAVNLLEVVRESPHLDDATLARKVRGALHQHLTREARVVTGPPLKSPERLQLETLRDRDLRATLAEIARERGRADGSVEREARKDLREIAATYSPRTVGVFKWVLDWVFERIYDGVEVDEPGLQRVAKAAAHSPIVVCPSHKSHVDYLIINYVFLDRGLVSPHIAAGINLAFWPLGTLFRKSGAFFIRRSFKGDRVYSAVLRAYVRKLVNDGFSQEFFVEGGRSRTGKVLLPRFGMISMEVDAWVDGRRPDLVFCPAWIGYEKIIEAGSYAHELGGGEKKKEDIAALLTAPKVLVSRYGRIYLRFDEPVSLQALAAERGFSREAHTEDQKRDLVRALGYRIVHGINGATALTPMGLLATALLAHDRRGLTAADLVERMEFLKHLALDVGGRLSFRDEPAALDPRGDGPVAKACAQLARDKTLVVHETGGEHIYAVPDEQRITLDYHKNTALHFFVPDALLATAVLTAQSRERAAVQARTLALSRQFKHEFVYEAGRFEQLFARRVQRFIELGLVAEQDGRLEPTSRGAARLRLLADLLVNFVEGYVAATESLALLLEGPRDGRDWMKQALDRARGAFLAGRLRRRESFSKVLLENAFTLFEERGLVVRAGEKGRQRAPGAACRSHQQLAVHVAEARSFLVPRGE